MAELDTACRERKWGLGRWNWGILLQNRWFRVWFWHCWCGMRILSGEWFWGLWRGKWGRKRGLDGKNRHCRRWILPPFSTMRRWFLRRRRCKEPWWAAIGSWAQAALTSPGEGKCRWIETKGYRLFRMSKILLWKGLQQGGLPLPQKSNGGGVKRWVSGR